jgi:dihydrodipicolinate synthase/N-acetylneuraminate lyase
VDTVVPYGPDGRVDLGAARAHALWLLAHDVDGFAPAATEFLHVDRREREKLFEVYGDVAPGRPILACIWDPSPARCVRLAQHAADHGATLALLPPPLTLSVRDDVIVEWYRTIGAAIPLPLLAWSHPGFQNPLPAPLAGRLADEAQVAGWLDASGDLHHLRRLAAGHTSRTWVDLDEGFTAEDLVELPRIEGLAGGVSQVANAWPELVRRAWVDGGPEPTETLARRGRAVRRAGGPAALRRLLGMHSRVPLAGVDEGELGKMPGSGFR